MAYKRRIKALKADIKRIEAKLVDPRKRSPYEDTHDLQEDLRYTRVQLRMAEELEADLAKLRPPR